jgi:hypothetical protein
MSRPQKSKTVYRLRCSSGDNLVSLLTALDLVTGQDLSGGLLAQVTEHDFRRAISNLQARLSFSVSVAESFQDSSPAAARPR